MRQMSERGFGYVKGSRAGSRLLLHSPSPSQFTTDGQSVSASWCRAPSGAHDQIVVNCLTVAVLSCSCALSDERSGLSFALA
jgi:hypothetical protein